MTTNDRYAALNELVDMGNVVHREKYERQIEEDNLRVRIERDVWRDVAYKLYRRNYWLMRYIHATKRRPK
jgi:hypothetical protein